MIRTCTSIPEHYTYMYIHTWTLYIHVHPYLNIIHTCTSIPEHYTYMHIHTWTLYIHSHPYLNIIHRCTSIPEHYTYTWTSIPEHFTYDKHWGLGSNQGIEVGMRYSCQLWKLSNIKIFPLIRNVCIYSFFSFKFI